MKGNLFFTFAWQIILVAAAVSGLAAYPLIKYFDAEVIEWGLSGMVFFLIISLATFPLILRGLKSKGNNAMMGFLAASGIKMLLSLFYVLLMLKGISGKEIEFVLCFMASYFSLTLYEVYFLIYNLRQISDGSKNVEN